MRIPAAPIIYQVNTWVWLADLETRFARPLTLADVPDAVWDEVVATSLADVVWLMGVWTRSPASAAVAAADAAQVAGFRRTLADYEDADNVGSAYAVRSYEVDPRLGGRTALAAARSALARRGVALLLDFVPNHVAPDHPWAYEHPEYFIHGTPEDLHADPPSHLPVSGRILASGRDPNFPAWADTLQLNLHSPALRAAMRETLLDIAAQCDGVRADMAMLVLDDVVQRTWGHRAGRPLERPFWEELIPAVRAAHPGFLFVAEAYWNLEPALIAQGFDLCYDKVVLDRLEQRDAVGLAEHLQAPLPVQQGLVRFIENHDEKRAAHVFPGRAGPAAAVVALTLPGAVLLHEGQLEGRTHRVEVFLRRRPPQLPDEHVRTFYADLLRLVRGSRMRAGTWRLRPRQGPITSWSWEGAGGTLLVAVNITDARAPMALPVGARTLLAPAPATDQEPAPGHHPSQSGVELGPWDVGIWQVPAGG